MKNQGTSKNGIMSKQIESLLYLKQKTSIKIASLCLLQPLTSISFIREIKWKLGVLQKILINIECSISY